MLGSRIQGILEKVTPRRLARVVERQIERERTVTTLGSSPSGKKFRPLARPDGSGRAKPSVAGRSKVDRVKPGATVSSSGARPYARNFWGFNRVDKLEFVRDVKSLVRGRIQP